MVRGLGGTVAALGVEPPFEFVALDHQSPGDQAVTVAQRRVADVDQQRAVPGGLERLARADPVQVRADPVQQLVYPRRLRTGPLRAGAHSHSSGRSTCSSRSTAPVRL
ncbi:hypothetical protein GCM10009654_10620 [Streptomyces hebeiensis]|uniref:Uncharacterized protein n=1 Tax=Streptomyces hebeiensis TaxID=229486 RepID=A0ABP4F6B4_9ACTN